MIVTSSHGFAAIARARDEQLISHETAKQYKRGHAIPIADLLSSIRLYMLLRRVDSTVPTGPVRKLLTVCLCGCCPGSLV